MDRWKTLVVGCRGGLDLNSDTLALAQKPGIAVNLVNFEPSIYGGYRRINGYSKYDTNAVTGTGALKGVAVYSAGVIACRGNDVYYSTGAGWSASIGTRTSAVRYRFVKYNWSGTEKVIMVDEANYPARWDGTTYTLINGAGAPTNPKFVEEFKNHIFYAGYSLNKAEITWCTPNDETDFNAANGAGAAVVGDEITGLKKFRDNLIIFCKNKIMKLTGDGLSTFKIEPITANIGCIAPDSIQEINGDLMFLSPDGIRPLAATARIDDVEISTISRSIHPLTIAASNLSNICSVVVREKSQYRLFYNSASTSTADARGLIGGLRSSGENGPTWEWGELLGINPVICDSDYLGSTEYVVHAGYDGYVYRQENGNTFDGASVNAVFTTGPLFFDDPAVRKILQKLDVYYRVEGATTLNITILYDYASSSTSQPMTFALSTGDSLTVYGSAVYGTSSYGGDAQPEAKSNVVGSGFTIQIKFNSSGTDTPYTIQGFKIQYALGGRR